MPEKTLEQSLPELSHGDHCCLFFASPEEQSRATTPFLTIGLSRDERCVFVGDDASIEALRENLGSEGVDVEEETRKKRLVLTSARDYLDDGHWRTEKMLGFLQRAYDSAMADRCTALRAVGDVAWQVGPHREFQDVVYYEALLDLFFIGKRMVGMCQYPRDRCPPDALRGILDTHKTAVIDSNVCRNFHYVPPDLLVEKDAGAREKKRVDWMTSQLIRVKKAEEERDELQRRLLQSQKIEAIGRLASGVAHDFNNVLTVILGLSEMLLDGPEASAAVKGDVKEIHLSGERAAALTRQLLAFSRRRPLQPRILSVNEVVGSMERFLTRIIGGSVEVATLLSPAAGNVLADPGQLEQVIMNLAINARDAMPNGGRLVIETDEAELGEDYAEAHPEAPAGPYVALTVSDTGHGMDPETLSHIFEPFFTTKEPGKGTGLGLATVRDIVAQAGGSLSVHSEPGRGTTFKAYFPRVEGPAVPLARGAGAPESLKGTETILVVDDDDAVRKLVHRVLVDRGYTVLDAISPPEAVKFCERHKGPIHLMIADPVLPQTGGRELAKRAVDLRPKMKVLFMSGCADDAAVGRISSEGAGAFLEKPFSPDALLSKVRQILNV
ncbi:MAG: MEDS domain-containing protein [Elusimicrobia bacterium]|nr:MEDS domain-containing protein [Elusimicrobiota bacterium]